MGKVILEEHIDRPCRVCSGTTFRIRPSDGRRVCYQCMKSQQKRYRDERGGKQKMKNWQQKNREHLREYQNTYYNFKERNGVTAKRLRERTPVWADKKEIMKFYANRPEGYHVDHIIPLNGKTVSGLHVIENLQYLPAEKNLKKSNKFEQ